ncbi:MAG: NrfD/PsrC family molybdoenzyme membrane anchor subunit [Frankiaceae bacterium]
MSESEVTREGIERARPDTEALTGAREPARQGRGRHGRRGGQGRRGGEQPMVPRAEFGSYYGKPVLNQPVWKLYIPGYFFTGGLAAGSSLLALGADATGNAPLRRQARYTAMGALLASTVLLIVDLGKPTRFHHMLRMVKPTSPMSVGSWILFAYAPGAGGAAVSEWTGLLRPLGSLAGAWAALMAPPLASYTAVLLADTAVPIWHEERLELPFAFVGSAMAASGGLAMAANDPADARPARRLAVIGATVETVATKVSKRRSGELGEVYDHGRARALRKVSDSCTLAGAALVLLGGRRRPLAVAAGALLMAGSLTERLAVFEAGLASAKDPKYVVKPQRERIREHGPVRSSGPHITFAADNRRR